MLEKVIKERKHERSIIRNYIVNNQINFAKLPKIESYVRVTLLRWLTKGMSSPNRISKTEDGRTFKVILPKNNENCVLDCEDGKLQMPAYKIVFE